MPASPSGTESGSRLDQSISFEHHENVLECRWWVLSGIGDPMHGAEDRLAAQDDLIEDEVVGRFRLHVSSCKHIRRKVLQIVGHDHLSMGFDRRRKHMTVVWVR